MIPAKITKFILIVILLFLIGVLDEYPKYKDYYDDLSHIYFFDVGQGDSILIKTFDHKLILIDGGGNDSVIFRISEVLPLWIKRIDYVVVTHPHADHIFGLISVINQYDVGCVQYDDSMPSISKIEEEFRNASKARNLISSSCIDGVMENYKVNSSEISDSDNPNMRSIISVYTYKDFDVLFTGDAEIPVQVGVLPLLSKDIEIIKVPHHGSKDSFYTQLLFALRPEVAIISVGKDNKYHLPSQDTIDGYEGLGIKVLRTDFSGSIEVISDGNLWSVVE